MGPDPAAHNVGLAGYPFLPRRTGVPSVDSCAARSDSFHLRKPETAVFELVRLGGALAAMIALLSM